MSLRKKRKASAPGRLASPFVDHDEINDDDNDITRRTASYNIQRRGSGGNGRNLFSRITNNSTSASSVFERTIAEEALSPNIYVDDVDNNNQQRHRYWGDVDEDEGYNSPHPSPRRATSPVSPPSLKEPDNPGELTLHHLVCSFVAESEKKINAFTKSVSFVCKNAELIGVQS